MKFLFILLLTCFGLFSSYKSISQNDSLYGLSLNVATLDYDFIKVSTASGEHSTLTQIPEIEPFIGFTKPIINPINSTYNFIGFDLGIDSLANAGITFLYSISTVTGAITSTQVDSNIISLDFNCQKNTFYFISYDYNTSICKLYQLDVSTNLVSIINSDVSLYPIVGGSDFKYISTFDVIEEQIIIHGYPTVNPIGPRHIYNVEVLSGNIVNDFTIVDPNRVHQLVYNVVENKLYAMDVNFGPNERSLVEVDGSTFSTTSISSSTYDFWYFTLQSPVISSDGKVYYVLGAENSSGAVSRIYSFEIATGLLTYSNILASNIDVQYIAIAGNQCNSASVPDNTYNSCEFRMFINADGMAQFNGDYSWIDMVTIYNVNGQKVESKLLSSSQINFRNIANGSYIAIASGDQCNKTMKFVLTR